MFIYEKLGFDIVDVAMITKRPWRMTFTLSCSKAVGPARKFLQCTGSPSLDRLKDQPCQVRITSAKDGQVIRAVHPGPHINLPSDRRRAARGRLNIPGHNGRYCVIRIVAEVEHAGQKIRRLAESLVRDFDPSGCMIAGLLPAEYLRVPFADIGPIKIPIGTVR